jgi:hypothetical protein
VDSSISIRKRRNRDHPPGSIPLVGFPETIRKQIPVFAYFKVPCARLYWSKAVIQFSAQRLILKPST